MSLPIVLNELVTLTYDELFEFLQESQSEQAGLAWTGGAVEGTDRNSYSFHFYGPNSSHYLDGCAVYRVDCTLVPNNQNGRRFSSVTADLCDTFHVSFVGHTRERVKEQYRATVERKRLELLQLQRDYNEATGENLYPV